MKKIYGVDLSKKVTPIQVRDAIVKCFISAHCGSTEIKDIGISKDYCERMVRKGFNKTGGDYESPTKESIINVMNYLAEFSEYFRGQKEIEKNYKKVMKLVEKIK